MPNSVAEQFDPYYKWLGIPPDQQPPDHYRLLGIRTFEDDREVIAIAADRQMAHVKTFAVGKYSQESQKLLDELAKAKLCLLNSTKKAAYDSSLQTDVEIELEAPSPLGTQQPSSPRREDPAPVIIRPTGFTSRSTSRSRRQGTPIFVWATVACLILVAGFLLFKMRARYTESLRQQQAARTVEPTAQQPPLPRERSSVIAKGPQSNQPYTSVPSTASANPTITTPAPPTHRDFERLRSIAAANAPSPSIPSQTTPQPEPALQAQEPKLTGLPVSTDLPPVSDTAPATLGTVPPETALSLVSIDGAISLTTDNTAQWKDYENNATSPVASFAVEHGELRFRWHDNVSEAGEAAVRNSLLSLQLGDAKHAIALRQPTTVGDEISFELIDNKFVVKSPAESPPPTDAIRFQLLATDSMPPHDIEGGDPGSMAVGDSCVLRYFGARDAWTTISMRKTGKVAVVEFVTMYSLPSGRKIPMSIKKGNAEVRKIERELQNIADARRALPRLKNELNQAQTKLGTASRMNNLIAANQLQALINNLDAQIVECNRLIAIEPEVTADQKEQRTVTELAQELENVRNLPYRFYMLIDDHEVDLIRAEP